MAIIQKKIRIHPIEELKKNESSPEAMNDPENRQYKKKNTTKSKKRPIRDYNTIKNKLDEINKKIKILENDYNNPYYRTKMTYLEIVQKTLKWVLNDKDVYL